MLDLNNVSMNDIQAEINKLQKLKKVLELQQATEILQRDKTKSEEYNKKKVSSETLDDRETAYNRYSILLTVMYLKFNGVATIDQLLTINEDKKHWSAIKKNGLCKVVNLFDREVFILHSFSLVRMLGDKKAKTLRFSDSGIKKQLRINNWNIANYKHSEIPVYSLKSITTVKQINFYKELIADEETRELGQYLAYSFPQLQLLKVAKQLKTEGYIIDIQNSWKVEIYKIKAVSDKTKYNYQDMSKYAVKQGDSLVFIFDIFKKGIVNVNLVPRNGHFSLYFDFIDHSQALTRGKVKRLRRLLEDLTNLIFTDTNGLYLDIRPVLNIWTHDLIKTRLEADTDIQAQQSIPVKYRKFNYSL